MAEHCKISAAIVAESEERSRSYAFGYSRTKRLIKVHESVTSPPFCVGGHDWILEYVPKNGVLISVYLVLDSAGAKDVKAKVRFSLLDNDGVPVPSCSHTIPEHVFPGKGSAWGVFNFVKREDLERPAHLIEDCFTIRCDVTVMKEFKGQQNGWFVKVPPSDLHRHLGDFLKSGDGTDVTFQVDGKTFSAHRSVLAARSPVFKAELFGAMKENSRDPVKVEDMEADVFGSLLHFIYTDSLPQMTREGDDAVAASHLLVAADRYDVQRLKLICEEKLCSHIDTDTVTTSLVLAEQHNCHGLKEACLQFLASPANLEAMKASDGYVHLKSSCPSVLKELIARLLPVELKAAKDIVMEI
ncbi:BTB/POZ and MATH domain-containing protein 1-like [Aegilops tauschii subsp. strangulata]|uniref:Speckle-type POZ protein-like protein n=1 Tax=Aegilops tauschii TaxID=37682 RepID=M8B2Q5_AEGTA|nr:BTB/POZ and MATH domain-containing protein 1-like [Aegilops tauschii subsp. strangulata]